MTAHHAGSAIVVRALGGSWDSIQGLDMAGQYRMDAVLALHDPVDDQDGLAVGDLAVAVVDVWLDRHVDLAVLVLEGEEADLLGRARRLAGDDEPSDADRPVVAYRRELVAFDRAHCAQAVATEVDEVMASREVADPVLELVGIEGIDVGQHGGCGVEPQLRLFFDASS